MVTPLDRRTVLGISFINAPALQVVEAGLSGGLVVVPSAPVLVDMVERSALREALRGADMAITDSGLMVLLWWLLKREKLERVSGLEYLKLLLERLKTTGDHRQKTTGERAIFWVMPTVAAQDRNLTWLKAQGFLVTEKDCYVAPMYPAEGPLADENLLGLIVERRPAHVILALGGGVQERLGWFLRQELEKAKGPAAPLFSSKNPKYVLKPASSSAVPSIHCIGAAIGFLSGEQVGIPMWVDYLYLGWLWRLGSSPRRFAPRYWKAVRLVQLMARYREKTPTAE